MILETLNDIPLAITEAKLSEINIFLDAYMKGENKHVKNDKVYETEVVDKIAIAKIYGILTKKMNLMTEFSEGTLTQELSNTLIELGNDKKVDAIVLDCDSPGGTVDGTADLADIVANITKIKPIIAYVNGQMTSAAYWICSPADVIVINQTSVAGSIGVNAQHYDYSEMDKKLGITRTFTYKGRKKGLGNDAEPLSQEGKNELQAMVDKYYGIFLNYVIEKRKLNDKQAESVGESGIYIGNDAVDVGLADGIGTLNDAIEIAKYLSIKRRSMMTLDELRSENLALHDQIFSAGLEKGKIEMQASVQDAITAERTRCFSIVEMTGDETALKAVREGQDTGTFYKEKLLAERKDRVALQANLLETTPPVTMTKVDHKACGDGKDVKVLLDDYVLKGMKRSQAILKVKSEFPDLYDSYIQGGK